MSDSRVVLKIGGVVCRLQWPKEADVPLGGQPYANFLSDDSTGDPDLDIEVIFDREPEMTSGEPVFDTQYAWGLFRAGDGYLYRDYLQRDNEPHMRRYAVMSTDMRRVSVYCDRRAVAYAQGLLNWVFDIPLGQVLLTHLVTSMGGVIVHGCGIKHQDRGYMFTGPSGAGKSTMAHLWRDRRWTTVLSDERLILRPEPEGIHMHGTPWPGSGFAFACESVLLRRVSLIEHAIENSIVDVDESFVLPIFLSNMRLPLWDRAVAGMAMDTVSLILQRVDFYKLGFVPTPSIVDLFLSRCQ